MLKPAALLRSTVVAVIASSALALPCYAQVTSPWTLDFGTGLVQGQQNGATGSGSGLTVNGQLTWQSQEVSGRSFVVGANASGFLRIGSGSNCLAGTGIVQQTANVGLASQGCLPSLPQGGSVGVLAGVERRIKSSQVYSRLSAGPMLLVTTDRNTSLGGQGRLDLTIRGQSRAQFLVWLQGGYAPFRAARSASLISIGVGIRARDLVNQMQGERTGKPGDCCVRKPASGRN